MPRLAWYLALTFAFLLWSAGAASAEESWQLFAKSKTAKVYFDRSSVRTDEDYVRFRIRIEYDAPRQSRNKKYEYSSSLNA